MATRIMDHVVMAEGDGKPIVPTAKCRCVRCRGRSPRASRKEYAEDLIYLLSKRLLSREEAVEAMAKFDRYHDVKNGIS